MRLTLLTLAFLLTFLSLASVAQQSATDDDDETLAPGGVAQGPLPALSAVPINTVVVGGFVVSLVTGLVMGVFVGDDSPTTTTTTTN